MGDEENPSRGVRGADGEYDDTRDATNAQLVQQQKDHLAKQDQQLDDITGIVSAIKYEGQNFNEEATLQNKMLTKLDGDIEATNDKMMSVDNNMKRLIQKSNQKALYVILCLEVLCLILTIAIP